MLTLAVLAPVAALALPKFDFVVSDVRISGLERVSLGNVFRILPIQPGDRIDPERIQFTARTLFATDQFDDIQFRREGEVLHILLEERPWIKSIAVSGNRAISEAALLEGLADAGLKEGEVFRRATIESIKQELLRQYVGQGRYTASINVNTNPRPQNQVDISIEIDEGRPARIKRINVIGNHVLSDEEILSKFQLSAGGFFTFLTGSNKYSREKLSGDLEALRSRYLNLGYANFRLDSVEVSIDDAEGGVYIGITLEEGPVHRIGKVRFSGDPPLTDQELRRMLAFSEGTTFSQDLIVLTEEIITRRLNNLGYSFAKVGVVTEDRYDSEGEVVAEETAEEVAEEAAEEAAESEAIVAEEGDLEADLPEGEQPGEVVADTATTEAGLAAEPAAAAAISGDELTAEQTEAVLISGEELPTERREVESIDLTVYIDTGKQTYVRRINFTGNEQTLDFVLRREMRQVEGAAASSQAMERSRRRLERSGYFRGVEMETVPVPGTEDQVDLEFKVDEELSGSLTFNLGYSEASGTFYDISLNQRNFLGSGKRLSISAESSSYSRSLNFDYAEPYFTLDGMSMGFNFSVQQLNYENVNIAGYFTDSYSSTLLLGALLNDQQRIQFSFGLEDTGISQGTASFNLIDKLVTEHSDYEVFKLGTNWSYTTLNRGIFPTAGTTHRLNLEIGTGESLNYSVINWQSRFYFPLNSRLTLAWRQNIGLLDVFNGSQTPPFFKFFRAGGLSSLRGYDYSSLGPWAWGGSCTGAEASASSTTAVTVLCDTADGEEYRRLEPGTGGFSLDTIGGDVLFNGSLELILPTPFATDARSVRTVLFLDYGDAYASKCDPRYYALERCRTLFGGESSFSWSTGLALTWITGFGPLNFVLAYTPDENPWDETERFDFSLGNYY